MDPGSYYIMDSCFDDSEKSLFNVGSGKEKRKGPTDAKLMASIRECLESKIESSGVCSFRLQSLGPTKEGTSKLKESGMSPLEVAIACPLLEEGLRKLKVLTKHCPNVKIKFDFLDIYERFLVDRDTSLNDLKGRPDLLWHEKFAADLGSLQKLLKMAKDDLHYPEHSFLTTFMHMSKNKFPRLKAMIKSNSKLSKRLNNLKDDIKHLHNLAENARKNTSVAELYRQEISDETGIAIGTLVDYVDKYNRGRIQQNHLKIEMDREKALAKARGKHKEVEEENICHTAIITYCKNSLQSLEADISYWEKKYITDMEEIGLKMDVLDEEIGEKSSLMGRLFADFNHRNFQISKYESEKEKIFQQEILNTMMESVVCTMQAWIRGTMVRWELGQYSPDYARIQAEQEQAGAAKPAEPEEETDLEEEQAEEEEEEEKGEAADERGDSERQESANQGTDAEEGQQKTEGEPGNEPEPAE